MSARNVQLAHASFPVPRLLRFIVLLCVTVSSANLIFTVNQNSLGTAGPISIAAFIGSPTVIEYQLSASGNAAGVTLSLARSSLIGVAMRQWPACNSTPTNALVMNFLVLPPNASSVTLQPSALSSLPQQRALYKLCYGPGQAETGLVLSVYARVAQPTLSRTPNVVVPSFQPYWNVLLPLVTVDNDLSAVAATLSSANATARCAPSSALAALAWINEKTLVLNGFSVSTVLTASPSEASIVVCLGGSDVLAIELSIARSVSPDRGGARLLLAGVNASFVVTTVGTVAAESVDTCNSQTSNVNYSLSSEQPITGDRGTMLQNFVIQLNSLSADVAVCVRFVSGLVSFPLDLRFSAIEIAFPTTAIVRTNFTVLPILVPRQSSPVWPFVISGVGASSVMGTFQFFVSPSATCTSNGATWSASLSGNTVAVLPSWYVVATLAAFLCVHVPTGDNFAIPRHIVQVINASTVKRWNGTQSFEPEFLGGRDASVAVVGRIFFDVPLWVGVVSDTTSSRCDAMATVSPITMIALLSTGQFSRYPNGFFCFTTSSNGTDYITSNSFRQFIITSLGENGVPVFSSNPKAETVTLVQLSAPMANSSIINQLSIILSDSICNLITNATITFAHDFSTVRLYLPRSETLTVCWRYNNTDLDWYTPATKLELVVVPAVDLNRNNFSAFASRGPVPQTLALSFSGVSGKTIPQQGYQLSVFPASGASSCTAVSAVPFSLAPMSSTSSTVPVSLLSAPAGLATLCGCYVPGSRPADVYLHSIVLGYVEYVNVSLGVVTVPSVALRRLIVLSTGFLELKVQVSKIPVYSPNIDFSLSSDCSQASGLLASLDLSSPISVVNANVSSTVNSSSGYEPFLCARFNGAGTYASLNIKVTLVAFSGVDGLDIATSATALLSRRPAEYAAVALLSRSSRTVVVQGINMLAPSMWGLLLFETQLAHCSDTPAVTVAGTALSGSSGRFSTPSLPPSQYLLVCLYVTDELSLVHYLYTAIVIDVVEVGGFTKRHSDGSQQTSLVSVAGVPSTVSIILEPGAGSVALSFALFATNSSVCTLEAKPVPALLTAYQFLTQGTASLVLNASATQGGQYVVCASTTMTLGGALVALTATTGVVLSVVPVFLSRLALNSGAVLGVTVGESLDLRITGSLLSDALLYFALSDVGCSLSALTGLSTYGNSRSLMKASGCGSTASSALLPSVGRRTTAPMDICMAVAVAQDDPPQLADLVPFRTGIYYTATEASTLLIVQEPSPTSNFDGTISQQPILVLHDPGTGTSLASIPATLVVRADWVSTNPAFPISEGYTVTVEAGSSTIDFSTANIKFSTGVFGVQYVLQFSVISGMSLAPVNSSAFVTRGACASTSDLGVIYSTRCTMCPSTLYCDGSDQTRVKGSSWRANNFTFNLYSCSNPYADDTCLDNSTAGTCREGHHGPRCTVCDRNWAFVEGQCIPCGDPALSWFLVALVFIAFFGVVAILVLSTLKCKKSDQFPIYVKLLLNHLTVASTVGEFSTYLPKVVAELFKVQRQASRPSPEFASFDCVTGFRWYDKFVMINVLPMGAAMIVALALYLGKRRDEKQLERGPSNKGDDDDGENNVVSNPMEPRTSSSGEKGAPSSRLDDTLAGIGAELVLSMDVSSSGPAGNRASVVSDRHEMQDIANLTSQRSLGIIEVSDIVKRQRRRHVFAVIMVIVLFFCYPSIVEWCANVLKCDQIDASYPTPDGNGPVPNITTYFYYDRSKLCTSNEHRRYTVAGLCLGCIWGFGVPGFAVVLFWLLARPKSRGGIGRVGASRMFTFLMAGYRREVWWWEAPMLIRKLLLIYIMAFIQNAQLQTLLAFWVLATHLVAHNMIQPYEYATVDSMERWSLIVICLTLNLSLLYEWVSLTDACWRLHGFSAFLSW